MSDTKKNLLTVVLRTIFALITAVGAVYGITLLSSCSAYKTADAVGRTSIVTVDTTVVNHLAGFSVSIKRK